MAHFNGLKKFWPNSISRKIWWVLARNQYTEEYITNDTVNVYLEHTKMKLFQAIKRQMADALASLHMEWSSSLCDFGIGQEIN